MNFWQLWPGIDITNVKLKSYKIISILLLEAVSSVKSNACSVITSDLAGSLYKAASPYLTRESVARISIDWHFALEGPWSYLMKPFLADPLSNYFISPIPKETLAAIIMKWHWLTPLKDLGADLLKPFSADVSIAPVPGPIPQEVHLASSLS